jgi:hypothetical protein
LMILRNLVAIAVGVGAWTFPAQAQLVTWSAPVLDYFYDASSNSIKTVSGVPGAASIDGIVPSAVKLQRAYIAPGRRFAIVQVVDGSAVLLDWSNGSSVREVSGAPAVIDAVAFSRSGSIAAVLSSGKVQVWRGLPDDPAIQQEIAFEATSLAVSDDGTVAAVQPDGIYLLDSGEPKLIAAGEYSALAFRPGTRDLAAAGRFTDTVMGIRIGAGASTLASGDDGIAEPVALEFSSDGSKLVIANRRGRSATIVDMAATRATSVTCDCNALVASPATSSAVFRIAESDGAVVFLDASSADLRTFTVPVIGETR